MGSMKMTTQEVMITSRQIKGGKLLEGPEISPNLSALDSAALDKPPGIRKPRVGPVRRVWGKD